ncbi:MAG: hypothetical protein OXG15_07240 [Gammaproteobacteria bacterium]|nr:hypothetical protein [Gammaproteobacteria bacterium]
METFSKINQRELKNVQSLMRHIPTEAKKTTRRAVERKAKEMVGIMRSIVPVDQSILKGSIEYRLLAQGLKAAVFAGARKGGAVAKHVEFGTKKRGTDDAQPFFVPTVKLMRKRINDSLRRSLNSAVKKAGGYRGA